MAALEICAIDEATPQLRAPGAGDTYAAPRALAITGGLTLDANARLHGDAANTLALRNSTNAQTFNIYNTTDGTNYERGFMRWASNVLEIGTEKAGTGTARNIQISLGTANTFTIGGNNNLIFNTNNGTLHGTALTFSNYSFQAPDNYDTNGTYVKVRSDGAYAWSSNTTGFNSDSTQPAAYDLAFVRVGAGLVGIRGASAIGAALNFIEQTAPAAPAANGVYIYAQDNGAGKTQLMALFASGAAQQIAIEP